MKRRLSKMKILALKHQSMRKLKQFKMKAIRYNQTSKIRKWSNKNRVKMSLLQITTWWQLSYKKVLRVKRWSNRKKRKATNKLVRPMFSQNNKMIQILKMLRPTNKPMKMLKKMMASRLRRNMINQQLVLLHQRTRNKQIWRIKKLLQSQLQRVRIPMTKTKMNSSSSVKEENKKNWHNLQ